MLTRQHLTFVQQLPVNNMATKTSLQTSLHRPVVSQLSKLLGPAGLIYKKYLYIFKKKKYICIIENDFPYLYFFTVSIFPESGSFNVDNVRVCKILVRICGLFFFSTINSFGKFHQCGFSFHLKCLVLSGLWSHIIFRAAWHGL